MPEEGAAPVVSVRELTRRFGSFTAVDHVSFDVARGEIFGFIGPNGAGKSTTIRILCGLLRPSGGAGTVAGLDITREQEAIKRHIGYMSQRFSLYGDLTVEENIDFWGGVYGLDAARLSQRKEWVLSMAGLASERRRLTAVLATGFKQRLALGCAVLHEPPILFLDEPTSGVDPISRRRFWDLIHSLAGQGVTVFTTTHYMEEAEYCDRIALIYRGCLIALGTPSELKTERMSQSVLEIACDRPHDALDEVERLKSVDEAALFGDGLHAVVADADLAARDVRELLTAHGFSVRSIAAITPTLEDVFVSLIEETDRQLGRVAEVLR
jgi:ABC-2 type transport system ATP-binding protein